MSEDQQSYAGRPVAGSLFLGFILLMIVSDLLVAEPIDPYATPYPVALGSGQSPSGAHCTSVFGLGAH